MASRGSPWGSTATSSQKVHHKRHEALEVVTRCRETRVWVAV